MINQLVGYASLVASATALLHAISKALTDRATARRLDAETDAKAEATRSATETANLTRLDHCEREHRARDIRDRERETRHAREIGSLRGQISALYDRFTERKEQA